jgi:hypothetical protein
VDSAESCAEFVRDRLQFLKLLVKGRRRAGVIRPFVTDEPGRFGDFAERFLGFATAAPVKVELPAWDRLQSTR